MATVLGALVYPGSTASLVSSALWELPSRVSVGHPIGYWANNSIAGTIAAVFWAPPVWTVVVVTSAAVAALLAARQAHRAGTTSIAG